MNGNSSIMENATGAPVNSGTDTGEMLQTPAQHALQFAHSGTRGVGDVNQQTRSINTPPMGLPVNQFTQGGFSNPQMAPTVGMPISIPQQVSNPVVRQALPPGAVPPPPNPPPSAAAATAATAATATTNLLPGPAQSQQELNVRIFKRNLGNAAVLRVLELIDFVSNEMLSNLKRVDFWNLLAPAYFAPSAAIKLNFGKIVLNNDMSMELCTGLNFDFLKQNLNTSTNEDGASFKLTLIAAPFFFSKCASDSGTKHARVNLSTLRHQVLDNGSIFIVARFNLQFTYDDDTISMIDGNVKILVGRDLRIEWMDVDCATYESFINFKRPLESKAVLIKELYNKSRARQNASTAGLTRDAGRTLQLGSILSTMSQLIEFSQQSKVPQPETALKLLVQNMQSSLMTQSKGGVFSAARGNINSNLGMEQGAQTNAEALSKDRTNLANGPKQEAKNGRDGLISSRGIHDSSANVSSPSPKTVNAEDPKKKRKAPAQTQAQASGHTSQSNTANLDSNKRKK